MKKIIISLIIGTLVVQSWFAARKLPDDYKPECVKRVINAKNIKTWVTKKFDNTCQLTEWWIEIGKKWYWDITAQTKKPEETKKVIKLIIPETSEVKNFAIISKNKIELLNSSFTGMKSVKKWTYSIILLWKTSNSWEVFLNIENIANNNNESIMLYVFDSKIKKNITFNIKDLKKDFTIWNYQYNIEVIN